MSGSSAAAGFIGSRTDPTGGGRTGRPSSPSASVRARLFPRGQQPPEWWPSQERVERLQRGRRGRGFSGRDRERPQQGLARLSLRARGTCGQLPGERRRRRRRVGGRGLLVGHGLVGRGHERGADRLGRRHRRGRFGDVLVGRLPDGGGARRDGRDEQALRHCIASVGGGLQQRAPGAVVGRAHRPRRGRHQGVRVAGGGDAHHRVQRLEPQRPQPGDQQQRGTATRPRQGVRDVRRQRGPQPGRRVQQRRVRRGAAQHGQRVDLFHRRVQVRFAAQRALQRGRRVLVPQHERRARGGGADGGARITQAGGYGGQGFRPLLGEVQRDGARPQRGRRRRRLLGGGSRRHEYGQDQGPVLHRPLFLPW